MDADVLALIRKYINDTTEPYDYSDEEIETIYTAQGSNLYLTVAEIWLLKAIATKSGSSINSYSIANESYNFKQTTYESYMEMYNFFKNKANTSSASLYERSANTEDSDQYKYDELMGGPYDSEFN